MCNSSSNKLLKKPLWLLPLLFGAVFFHLEGTIGVGFSDEGYLWAVSKFVSNGLIPIIDVQSYDPGRYYWNALWGIIFGNDLYGNRISVFLFQLIGLYAAYYLIQKTSCNTWTGILWLFLVILWMIPRHKLFDHSISLLGIFLAYQLIIYRNHFSFLAAGTGCGVAIWFGKNHGLYWLVAFLLVYGYLYLVDTNTRKTQLVMMAIPGLIIGISPFMVITFLNDGFLTVYVENILSLFNRGTTNLALPVPWPWQTNYKNALDLGMYYSFTSGMLFVYLLVFPTIGVFYLLKNKDTLPVKNAVLIATIAFSVPYAHYAFSRADVNHLAQGIMPLTVGLLAFFINYHAKNKFKIIIKYFISGVFVFCTLVSASISHPLFHKYRYQEQYNTIHIMGHGFSVINEKAQIIERISDWKSRYFDSNGSVLIVSNLPFFYPYLEIEKPPIYDIYLIFPKDEKYQVNMINNIIKNNTKWVILHDFAYDNRDELAFSKTFDYLYNYIKNHYVYIDNIHNVKLYHKIDN